MKNNGWLLLLLLILFAGVDVAKSADETLVPRIFNMRFEGLKIEDDIYVPSSEFGRDYKILVDFEGQAPIKRVFLQTRFADGRVSRVLERSFEVVPHGVLPGTLKATIIIPSRILQTPISRETDWWIEDANGRTSNKLVQRVVIRD